jgi:sulfur-carrier protein
MEFGTPPVKYFKVGGVRETSLLGEMTAPETPGRGTPAGPTLEVHLDSWLRRFGTSDREKLEADSVDHLIDVLEGRYPGLRFKLRDETGQLRRYVRVFVDGEDVSGTTGVATSLVGARTIDIIHSIAGG